MRLIPPCVAALPQVGEHNWLIHRIMIDYLGKLAANLAHGSLVDIGCGKKPYSTLFAPFVTQHIGIDLQDSRYGMSTVDVIGTAYDTSLPDATCDVVLCTEVLEHLERPFDAVREMYRILKVGGVVILTVPFIWPIHEAPRDFYRYSEYGLRFLFESAGFEVLEVRPLTGYIATFTQMTVYYLRCFHRGLVLRTIGRFLNHILQYVAYWLNRYDRSVDYTNLYGLVARKK